MNKENTSKLCFDNNKSYIIIFFILLAVIQILHFYNLNIYNLTTHFSDLKWSGAKLFLEDKNVYEIFYSNNYDDKIIKSQFPNYSIGSIYFHLPLGYFDMRLASTIWSVFIDVSRSNMSFRVLTAITISSKLAFPALSPRPFIVHSTCLAPLITADNELATAIPRSL